MSGNSGVVVVEQLRVAHPIGLKRLLPIRLGATLRGLGTRFLELCRCVLVYTKHGLMKQDGRPVTVKAGVRRNKQFMQVNVGVRFQHATRATLFNLASCPLAARSKGEEGADRAGPWGRTAMLAIDPRARMLRPPPAFVTAS